jgi:hypothetical protein
VHFAIKHTAYVNIYFARLSGSLFNYIDAAAAWAEKRNFLCKGKGGVIQQQMPLAPPVACISFSRRRRDIVMSANLALAALVL